MDKVTNGLNKLNAVLPLKDRQDKVDKSISDAHKSILRSFVDKGSILSRSELSTIVDDIDDATSILKENDMVVFDESNEPIGAYPFTMEEREHQILVNTHNVHAMCALDSLGISPMFDFPVVITSQCRVTEEPIEIYQDGSFILNKDDVKDVQFGVIWNASGSSCCCANSLCMEMMFLKDPTVATEWLEQDPKNREVYTLREAIEFSTRFFAPLTKD